MKSIGVGKSRPTALNICEDKFGVKKKRRKPTTAALLASNCLTLAIVHYSLNLRQFSHILKLFQLSHYHGWKEDLLDYHLHIVRLMYYFLYVPKWPSQRIYNYFQPKIDFFKIQNLDVQNKYSYSTMRTLWTSIRLFGMLFLICSKMATDLLGNLHIFLIKNLVF